MRRLVFVFLVIFSVTSYVADVDGHDGDDHEHESHDDYVPFDPYFLFNYDPIPATEIPKQRLSLNDMLTLYLALRYAWNNVLNPTTTTAATTAATDPPAETTTAAATTAPVVTIPVTQWVRVENCQYQLFKEKVTFNAADANCKIYGATLAQINMRDQTKRVNILNTINYPAGANFWVGAYDSDSALPSGNDPIWLDSTPLGYTPDPASYNTAVGTFGCAYHSSTFTTAELYKFTACSLATPADIPDYYLCELCP